MPFLPPSVNSSFYILFNLPQLLEKGMLSVAAGLIFNISDYLSKTTFFILDEKTILPGKTACN